MNSSKLWPCAALPHASLAPRTTLHVGGRAEWLLEPATPEELRRAIVAAREDGHEPRILGGGANLIVDDGVLPGVVITTDRMKRLFRPANAAAWLADDPDGRVAQPSREEGLRFVSWAGTTHQKLLSASVELGWSGLEGLAGVPGHVGGGVAMNAGGKWGGMWDAVERVLVVDERGELVELERAQCQPRYRNGGLGRNVVASVLLRFTLDTLPAVKERAREFLLAKNRVQPVTLWSAGCIFKNPDPSVSGGRTAGQLVDACGLKGARLGDAEISPLHGNFFVNRGNARARDLLALIERARAEVAERTGIVLEHEVKVWRAELDPARP
ncbi:MAG: FAD-binding protein [Planctomycetes bacterium]|nr:FAD-binding protein [Planctomycetota bacterium]